MKNIKKIVATALMGVFVFSIAGCDMIQKTPEAVKKTTVAKVKGDKITLGEVDEKLKPVIEQLKAQYGDKYLENAEVKTNLVEQRKQALNDMVNEKMMLKKAEELKLIPEKAELDKEVETKLTETKKVFENEDKFNEALKTENFTLDSFKELLKNQIIKQKVAEYITKDVSVSDEDIQKYYDDNKAQFVKKPGATISHILFGKEDADKQKAVQAKDELKKGAKFEDLAAKYGTDGTKTTGGSLGFIEYDTTKYDADFMTAAKSLKEGEVSVTQDKGR